MPEVSYILALSTGDNDTSAAYSVSEAAGKAMDTMDTCRLWAIFEHGTAAVGTIIWSGI